MNDHDIAQAVGQGSSTAVCGVNLGSISCAMGPVSETVKVPEPSFQEVRPLYSEKPLRFNRLRKLG